MLSIIVIVILLFLTFFFVLFLVFIFGQRVASAEVVASARGL
jgi:hypothetical protein